MFMTFLVSILTQETKRYESIVKTSPKLKYFMELLKHKYIIEDYHLFAGN